jgi:multidrug resistance efflux pump
LPPIAHPVHLAGRVQAFVVPVAAEVAGKVLAVHVRNNDDVQRGQALFDIDPEQYRIALQRSRSDYESVRSSVNASAATVEAARASLQAAQANHVKAEKDATRQEALYAEDPGAISVRRLEVAQATRVEARSQEQRLPRPTCARPRKPPARAATTTRSCAARARRSNRPSSTWRARRWSPPPAARSPTCAPMSAISPRPVRR